MFNTPADLAAALHRELVRRERPSAPVVRLCELLEVMYATSLKTEEGQSIEFHIAFVDPVDPDPQPPQRIRRYRWQWTAFADRIPFSVEQLTKLAKASDPRTSSLATYFDEDGLYVWGLTDQGGTYADWLNFDTEHAHAFRPGVFQASIDGPAHVSVWVDFDRIAELKGSALAGMPVGALEAGPLVDILAKGWSPLVAEAAHLVRAESHQPIEETGDEWSECVHRVMGRVFVSNPDPYAELSARRRALADTRSAG